MNFTVHIMLKRATKLMTDNTSSLLHVIIHLLPERYVVNFSLAFSSWNIEKGLNRNKNLANNLVIIFVKFE